MFLHGLRILCRLILKIIARVDIQGMEHIPATEGALIVSNHLGRLDAMLGVVLADRDDIILMIADKYEKYLFWRFLGNKLNAIWLNREEADFHALREVTKRLQAGGISGIAPEGTRSKAESLLPGKPGAAYLAAKTGVQVIPVALWGTEDRVVKERLLRLRRLDIHIRIGPAFTLPALKRAIRDEMLAQGTDEIMTRIAAMLPDQYRGVYADHPRLRPPQGDLSIAVLEPGD
ncbi:MAG: 1-acyl-sn-glycerol-3-phosphate acyltransferase [Chloroflexi bacterium]|nr:1-acyl-sn-glycerol-3-phosphate acyltransferase [Ardenticatenaceae bacterium]MBL1127598.1 1-acyl-sn-glycerol-3-phosphate acyltransferase [Chloroflexota bacterium]NOG33663.1 1-acyl-sn-glycerol-3-phosphate acyltransferase [Chloroflexota bacterium]GIK56621.1 MAG: 1-acyl-sn-glycerol-3-phosphate acyltransferase [Chloroflexota bacterium]